MCSLHAIHLLTTGDRDARRWPRGGDRLLTYLTLPYLTLPHLTHLLTTGDRDTCRWPRGGDRLLTLPYLTLPYLTLPDSLTYDR